MNKKSSINYFIDDAIQALHQGHLIVYPTDTLYALGCDIFNEESVDAVYSIKKRPFSVALPLAVCDLAMMQTIAFVNETVIKIVEQFLPGSLTIIVPKKKFVSEKVSAGLDTIAVRIPENAIALELLQRFGPLCVTSANIHGKPTPASIDEIKKEFGSAIKVFIDEGRKEGKPSTIVDLCGEKPKIVRQGLIDIDDIMDALK
ncbi:MAG: L-threonylcarbamoyladenylate synthase [Thermoplasmatota archaeon]